MIAHMPGAAVKEKESAGDCQTKATWESVVYCDLCKTHEFSRQPVAGDFGAHAP